MQLYGNYTALIQIHFFRAKCACHFLAWGNYVNIQETNKHSWNTICLRRYLVRQNSITFIW